VIFLSLLFCLALSARGKKKKGKGCNVSQRNRLADICLLPYLFISLKKKKALGTEPTLHSRAPVPLTNQMVAVGRVLTTC